MKYGRVVYYILVENLVEGYAIAVSSNKKEVLLKTEGTEHLFLLPSKNVQEVNSIPFDECTIGFIGLFKEYLSPNTTIIVDDDTETIQFFYDDVQKINPLN